MQERPQVTITDPARPEAAVDVLDSGPEPAPLLTRRRVVGALTAAAVLAGVSGLVELRERRALAAEERRLASEVSLSLPAGGSSGSSTIDSSGGAMQAQLLVHNDGPRDVEVVGARVAGFTLLQGVPLPAGQTRQLTLGQPVRCEDGEPGPLGLDQPLQLDVRTGAGTTTTTDLPLLEPPFGESDAARLCGYVPLVEAVFIANLQSQQQDGLLRIDVEIGNASRFPVEVVRLLVGPGLEGSLLAADGAAAVRLPTTLPPSPAGGFTTVPYEVEVRVVDCALAQGQPSSLFGLDVRDADGVTAETVFGYDPELLAELLDASCP